MAQWNVGAILLTYISHRLRSNGNKTKGDTLLCRGLTCSLSIPHRLQLNIRNVSVTIGEAEVAHWSVRPNCFLVRDTTSLSPKLGKVMVAQWEVRGAACVVQCSSVSLKA